VLFLDVVYTGGLICLGTRGIFLFFLKKVYEEYRKGLGKIKQNKNFSIETFKGSGDLIIWKINHLISRGN